MEGGLRAIDWEMTTQLLASQNLNGKKLPKMTELMFPFLGITDKRIIDQLVPSIHNLLNQPAANTKDNESNFVVIPSQFLCPISKQIMKDPVILAGDEHTCEQLIDQFLSEKRSIMMESIAIENVQEGSEQEGAEQEGVQETGYI